MSEWNFEPKLIPDDEVGLANVLRGIRRDLTMAQGKLTEAIRVVTALKLEDAGERVPCPRCGLTFPGPNTLADHVHVSHGGPLPARTAAADELVADVAGLTGGGSVD